MCHAVTTGGVLGGVCLFTDNDNLGTDAVQEIVDALPHARMQSLEIRGAFPAFIVLAQHVLPSHFCVVCLGGHAHHSSLVSCGGETSLPCETHGCHCALR